MNKMGIVSTGTWFPDTFMTAAEIAAQSGLPEWVVREKLGIERKFVADPNVHPNDMAVNAARKAVDKAGIDPMEIDVVLCTTEEWREHLLWTTAIDLAYRVGAKRAWGIDLHARCVTTIAALKMAHGLLSEDPSINTVLIGGGYAISHFIDLTDLDTSFLFNIGAGAGAMILKRDWPENQVLGNHLISDGSMSRHVIVPSSGTVQHPTDQAVAEGGSPVSISEPSLNPRTGVVEYWGTIQNSDFQDGRIELRAIAYPIAGEPRVLEPLVLYSNANGGIDAICFSACSRAPAPCGSRRVASRRSRSATTCSTCALSVRPTSGRRWDQGRTCGACTGHASTTPPAAGTTRSSFIPWQTRPAPPTWTTTAGRARTGTITARSRIASLRPTPASSAA